MLGVGSVSLVGSVVLSQSVDSNLASHVELIGDGSSSDVEPVIIVGGEVFGTGRLLVCLPLYL